jgi:hypothetical protein
MIDSEWALSLQAHEMKLARHLEVPDEQRDFSVRGSIAHHRECIRIMRKMRPEVALAKGMPLR